MAAKPRIGSRMESNKKKSAMASARIPQMSRSSNTAMAMRAPTPTAGTATLRPARLLVARGTWAK
jgi:hypothetical protein